MHPATARNCYRGSETLQAQLLIPNGIPSGRRLAALSEAMSAEFPLEE